MIDHNNVRAWLPEQEYYGDGDLLAQAERTARVAAVRGHVALMPDAHLGKGATIGSVIPTFEAIIPSAVGVDIGCGVVAGLVLHANSRQQIALFEDDLRDLSRLLDTWSQLVPAGLGNWRDTPENGWAAFMAQYQTPTLWEVDQKVSARAPLQLGTLGSGNHFLELCTDEQGRVWLMLHSGSRGPGNRLALHHIERAKGYMRHIGEHLEDPELAYLVQGTEEFEAYIHDLMWAQQFARWNRMVMMERALGGLSNLLGHQLEFSYEWYINNHHNYARLETHGGRDLWITRKGAIHAGEGELGVIPGSMGTGSYIVRGLGNPDSYHSASHGAGRRMSRRKAKRSFTDEDMAEQMHGVVWQSGSAKGLLDEIPGAYKDLDSVMALQGDLVEPVHHLTTLVNYKGVEEGRW